MNFRILSKGVAWYSFSVRGQGWRQWTQSAVAIIQASDMEGSDLGVNVGGLTGSTKLNIFWRQRVDRLLEKYRSQGWCHCFWPEQQEGWSCHHGVGEGVPEVNLGKNQACDFQHVKIEISNNLQAEMRDAEWQLDRQVWSVRGCMGRKYKWGNYQYFKPQWGHQGSKFREENTPKLRNEEEEEERVNEG